MAVAMDRCWIGPSQAVKLILFALAHFVPIDHTQAYIGREEIITIPDGKIKGITMETMNGREFISYQVIPYGKAPIGNLRFQPPQKVEPWEGVIDGTKPPEFCMQSDLDTGVIKGTEDCLTLAVATTQINGTIQELYPVIVYIFGGMFVFGPIDRTGPERLLDHNLLYVDLNYRLGLFGYAATSDELLPGNYGHLDQILALKWVQQNIIYFGGDPNRVTLMGHSTGGISVMSNIISPLSNGLIHGAIMQSGCRLCRQQPDYSFSSTLEVAQALNCSTNSSEFILDCFMNASAVNLQLKYDTFKLPFNSNVDNKFGYMPHPIMEMPFQPEVRKIPVIIGILPNDGAFLFKDSNKTIEDKIDSILKFGNIAQPNRPDITNQIMQSYDITYDKNKTAKEILYTLQDLFTDMVYKHCCDNSIEILAKAGFPIYAYVFKNHGSNVIKRFTDQGEREYPHSTDMYMLFAMEPNWNLTGNDLLTSNAMLHYWTNFATYGDPSPRRVRPATEIYPKWEKWTKNHPKHIVLERSPFIENGAFCDRKQFWDDIISKLMEA